MKKIICLVCSWLALTIFIGGCSSNKATRNPKFTYGKCNVVDIETVYDLVGNVSEYRVPRHFRGASASEYFIRVSSTANGGVVAYGEGLYVYSPDKNDDEDVRNALIQECLVEKP